MITYIVRRVLMGLFTLLMVVTLSFFAFIVIPGDAAAMYAGPQASTETLNQIRRELGLDRPIPVRYASYMKGLVQGNLGKSYITRLAVSAEIRRRFPNTLKLAVPAILMSMVLGIAMGLLAATNEGGGWDALVAMLTLAGISLPGFWLALLLMLVFSIQLDILPVAGDETWRHYPLPVTCLSVYSIAFITRMTRSSVLEVIGDDYVTTARAKGLHPNAVLLVHVLRNALIPVITIVGLRFGYMLGGAVVIETVFNWPGMGRMIVDGVRQRDIPMVQGGVLVFALAFILINLTVDIVIGIVDPRIRRSRG